MRVQFTPQSRTRMREPVTRTPAATTKAAEDGSDGTCTSSRTSSSTLSTPTVVPVRRSATPAARSRRSVWSRLGAGSVTDVVPSASSPASRTHDLTCALATGRSWWTPCSRAPWTVKGGRCPSVASMAAPMAASGAAMRSTGRRRIEASPSSVKRFPSWPGQPAREEPHEGPRVADVDGPVGLVGAAQARAAQDDVVAALLGDRPDRADRGEGGAGVGRVEEARGRARARRTSPRAGRRGG